MESSWVIFWQWVLGVGLAAYYLVALAVVPLGARDIFRLFRRLSSEREGDDE